MFFLLVLTDCCRYSMEYASQNKSVFHTLFMGAAKKAGIVNPGVSWRPEKNVALGFPLPGLPWG